MMPVAWPGPGNLMEGVDRVRSAPFIFTRKAESF